MADEFKNLALLTMLCRPAGSILRFRVLLVDLNRLDTGEEKGIV
jgi:hypothetical protein